MLAVEGGDFLNNRRERIKEIFKLGVRALTIVHSADNCIGYSTLSLAELFKSQGNLPSKKYGGLSEFGKRAIEELNELGLLIDLAHSCEETANDAINHSTRPVIASHTGAATVQSNFPRFISDDLIQKIADGGGIIGLWPFYLQPYGVKTRADLLQHTQHIKSLVGSSHLAIGTDITEKIKDAEKIQKIYDKIEIINKILIHDLQNALSVLQGYLDLYEETKDDLYFQSIKKIVEENFKTLKRMETATQSAEEFKQKKQRLTKIFEEMEERYQFFSDIVLHFDEIIDAEIKVDDNLYSIFDNLFMNSIMHGNAKNIFISSSKIKDKTNIILEDDSKISDIDIQKIIKDLDSYSLGKCSGLALVGKLMKNLNGEITISKNEQGGIRIILSFPDLD